MTPRDAFLHTVRQAVAKGNQAGAAPKLPERGKVGYQGAGPDPVERFCTELAAAGGKAYVANDREAVWQTIRSIIESHAAQRILVSRGGLVERLDIAGHLRERGISVSPLPLGEGSGVRDTVISPLPLGEGVGVRETLFAADVGISNVHRLIAETGTVVVATSPNEPRSVSLLPPVHIAIAERAQLLPDLFDLFDLFVPAQGAVPSCLTLITGPSKTGDIELRLVTGVHGPGEVHVILFEGETP